MSSLRGRGGPVSLSSSVYQVRLARQRQAAAAAAAHIGGQHGSHGQRDGGVECRAPSLVCFCDREIISCCRGRVTRYPAEHSHRSIDAVHRRVQRSPRRCCSAALPSGIEKMNRSPISHLRPWFTSQICGIAVCRYIVCLPIIVDNNAGRRNGRLHLTLCIYSAPASET